jgi:outer membrane protein assembly factor BamA
MHQAPPLRAAFFIAALAVATSVAAQQPPVEKPVGTTGTNGGANGESEKSEKKEEQPAGFVAKTQAWAEKQQRRFSKFTKPITDAGFSAEIGTLGQGSGLAAALQWRREHLFGSPIDIESSAGYSYRGYELYDVRFGRLRNFKQRTTLHSGDAHIATQFDAYKEREPGFGLYGNVRYRHSPMNRYWGMGPDTPQDARTSFTTRGASYEIVGEYQHSSFFGIGARGGILDLEVAPGGDTKRPSTHLMFDDTTAPGLRRQPAYAYAAAGTSFDTRDVPALPRSGGLLGLLVSRFDAINTGPEDLSFNRVALDGRYFVPATSRSVIALRVLTLRDFPDSGARVPFYMMQTLGGGDTLRGFERARFTDTALINFTAEYRFNVHKYVELAAFGDAGQVAHGFTDFSLPDFQTSFGTGVRIKHKESILLRADWGFSREGQRLILSMGPVF